jgi:type IV pilus assembly protein PilE
MQARRVPRGRSVKGVSIGGFTLIELMITLVVASILVTVAIPAYTSQMRKSRRTDAKTAIMDLAAREERIFSTTNSYSQTAADLGYPAGAWPQTVGNQYYTVTVQAPDPAQAPLTASFLITANPVAGGPQASDGQCTSFAVNQLGQQTATGTLGNACWP